jgi:hypothetical protein
MHLKFNSFDTHNKNGSELCHAVGCRKHRHIRRSHGGYSVPNIVKK